MRDESLDLGGPEKASSRGPRDKTMPRRRRESSRERRFDNAAWALSRALPRKGGRWVPPLLSGTTYRGVYHRLGPPIGCTHSRVSRRSEQEADYLQRST